MKTKKIALSSMLIALSLVLSYTERFIPLQLVVPLPGVKLGLANVVTMFALYFLDERYAVGILLPRCFLGAMFGGGISGLAYSLMGGLLSLGVMALTKRVTLFSIYGVSVLGAAAHNVGQIGAAMLLLKSGYIISYLPFLLVMGVAAGLVTGAVAATTFRALQATKY